LIATPHYDHTTIGIEALNVGLHVLTEKPISVHRADCERLIAAHKGQVFAAMFNQRTDPYYQKIREIVQSGALGDLRRVIWIITNWFRTETYYSSGGWRATWAGEGGGVLLNQCPHNLDLMQWLTGMPTSISAKCYFGKYHNIEVEDDVIATLEYANGATGTFITTTGESPGTNRLEIVGDLGKIVYENDVIHWTKTEVSVSEFNRTSPDSFPTVKSTTETITFPNHGGQHVTVLQNFVNAILKGETLIAPAPEGIHSVELANAMLMSAFTGQEISLPIDGAAYEALLQERIATSRYVKPETKSVAVDMTSSWSK
jgi:predicted dehydrogenase